MQNFMVTFFKTITSSIIHFISFLYVLSIITPYLACAGICTGYELNAFMLPFFFTPLAIIPFIYSSKKFIIYVHKYQPIILHIISLTYIAIITIAAWHSEAALETAMFLTIVSFPVILYSLIKVLLVLFEFIKKTIRHFTH